MCLNLFRPGWNEWNGTRLLVVVRSIPTCFVSNLNFQANEQPTPTKNSPTDFCGGTAQLDSKTGVPSRGQRVLLTQRTTLHANRAQGKRQSRLAIQVEPSGEAYLVEVMISPSRLDDDSRNFYDTSSTILPEIYRQSLVRRPVFSLVRLLVRPCLLYTSPSPRDLSTSRMPSSA